MTSFRFSAFFCGASFLVLLLAGGPAFSADDLPAPQDGTLDELPSAPDSGPQAPLADEGDMPAPSLGEENGLPAPNGDGLESRKNQVNHSETSDNIYLPTPAGNNDINYAPIGNSYGGNSNAVYNGNSEEWKSGMTNRPIFSMTAGAAFRNYATTLVPDAVTGYGAAISIRALEFGQTVFLHGMGGFTLFNVGDVAPGSAGPSYGDVRDKTFHLGAMLEIGLGRRFSLFGTLMRRWNDISYEAPTGTAAHIEAINRQRDPAQLQYIGEPAAIKPGIGAQYDFYVVPHGSMGLQARLEQDYFYVGLTMAIEPAPRKKMNLNFESLR